MFKTNQSMGNHRGSCSFRNRVEEQNRTNTSSAAKTLDEPKQTNTAAKPPVVRCRYSRRGCTMVFQNGKDMGNHSRHCSKRDGQGTNQPDEPDLAMGHFDETELCQPIPRNARLLTHRFGDFRKSMRASARTSQDTALGYEKTALLRPFALSTDARRDILDGAMAILGHQVTSSAGNGNRCNLDATMPGGAKANPTTSEIIDPDTLVGGFSELYDEDEQEEDTSGIEAAILANEWHQYRDAVPADYILDEGVHSLTNLDPDKMPQVDVAFIDLLYILQHHRTNLAMFDDIVQWAHHFSQRKENIFGSLPTTTKTTRAAFVNQLRLSAGRTTLSPKIMNVVSPHSSKQYSVPVYPCRETIMNMLMDPRVMDPNNFQTVNFDPVSFRPLVKPPGDLVPAHYDTCAIETEVNSTLFREARERPYILDDLYTGTMIHFGIHDHCPREVPDSVRDKVDLVRPLPICFFIDESHTDRAGRLKSTPLSYCFGFHRIEYRSKYDSQRVLAILPPFDAIDSKYHGAYDQALHDTGRTRRGKGLPPREKASLVKLRDYQLVLEEVFKELLDITREGGLFVHHEQGPRVLYKPFILLNIGDAKGNNILTCSFNSMGNEGTSSLSYSCTISFPELNSPSPCCSPKTRAMHEEVLQDPTKASKYSQHPVKVAMNELPLAEEPDERRQGVAGISPIEKLHQFGQGLYKDVCLVIHNLMGRGKKNAAHKDYFHMLLSRLGSSIPHNSDRDFPIVPPPAKTLNITMMNSGENMGNAFIQAISLCTLQGKTLFQPHCERHNISVIDVSRTVLLLLSFDLWSQARGTEITEVQKARKAVAMLMTMMNKYLPHPRYKRKKQPRKETVKPSPPPLETLNGERVRVACHPEEGQGEPHWWEGTVERVHDNRMADIHWMDGTTSPFPLEVKLWQGPVSVPGAWSVIKGGGHAQLKSPPQKDAKSPDRKKTKIDRRKTKKEQSSQVCAVQVALEDHIGIYYEHESAGCNGWYKYKFHGLYHIIDWMIKFGSSSVFSGDSGEEHHKRLTKYPGQNTQRRLSLFVDQVSKRVDEQFVIDYCHEQVEKACPVRSRFNRTTPSQYYSNTPDEMIGNCACAAYVELRGRYTLVFKEATTRNAHKKVERNLDYVLYFQDPKKNIDSVMDLYQIDESLTHTLSSVAIANGYTGQFFLNGYTEARVHAPSGTGSTIYHCTPNMRGQAWYDWAFIEWPEVLENPGVGAVSGRKCIGRIHGFFTMETKSFPTLKRTKIDKLTKEQLMTNTVKDETVYAVVSTNMDWISMEDLEKKFVVPFTMQEGITGMYVMPISAIVNPVTVVKDYSQDKSTRFLAVLPKRRWHRYFHHFIQQCSNGKEESSSEDEPVISIKLPDIEDDNDSDIELNVDIDEEIDETGTYHLV